jgi:16S rRNA (cytidine1402-2'-O)-methyltransferase
MNAATLGKLYLIPIPIAEGQIDTIPQSVKDLSIRVKYYFVENVRTARRYLKQLDKSINIDLIKFSEINQRNPADINLLKQWLEAGYEVGMMSEAGCPGVADPGSILVEKAQEMGALVMPQVGPSSILLALMASGFNGQAFRFGGYLPIKNPLRQKAIKQMEDWSVQRQETQIFIETPYRNVQMIEDLIQNCKGSTKLCIAANITADNQLIKTMTLTQWKKHYQLLDLQKTPCIFLIQA